MLRASPRNRNARDCHTFGDVSGSLVGCEQQLINHFVSSSAWTDTVRIANPGDTTTNLHEASFSFSRNLQSNGESDGEDGSSPDGPFAILIMVCVLVCLVWTPMFIQRRCRRQERLRRLQQQALDENNNGGGNNIAIGGPRYMVGHDDDAAAEFIRMSLRNFSLHGTVPATASTAARAYPPGGLSYQFSIRSMSLEDRKEYVENLLISKQIIKIRERAETDVEGNPGKGVEPQSNHAAEDDDEEDEANSSNTINVLVGDAADLDTTSDITIEETFPICLVEYREGDVLCWSQRHDKCTHCFHKVCMVEWLQRNEECPLCRHNYLSLNDDDDVEGSWSRPPLITQSVPQRHPVRVGFSSSHLSAPLYRRYLQHRDHSLSVPYASSTPSSMYERQRGGEVSADQAAYLRGVELVQLLQSLQLLSEAQQDASIRLDGIELAYPSRTLHETRSNHAIAQRRPTDSVSASSSSDSDVREDDHVEDEQRNTNDSEPVINPLNEADEEDIPPQPQQISPEQDLDDSDDNADQEEE